MISDHTLIHLAVVFEHLCVCVIEKCGHQNVCQSRLQQRPTGDDSNTQR